VYSDTATDGMKERTGKNAAPITGELDMHPVGTGVEAADGAVTGAALGAAIGGPIGAAVTQLSAVSRQPAVRMEWQKTMNPTTEEEKYWREYHAKQPYAEKGRPYEDYAGAYRTGYEGFHKIPGKAVRRNRKRFGARLRAQQSGIGPSMGPCPACREGGVGEAQS